MNLSKKEQTAILQKVKVQDNDVLKTFDLFQQSIPKFTLIAEMIKKGIWYIIRNWKEFKTLIAEIKAIVDEIKAIWS